MVEEDELLTSAQVAKMWRTSSRTVQRYIADGKLTGVRLPGGHYRIHRDIALGVLDDSKSSTPETHRCAGRCDHGRTDRDGREETACDGAGALGERSARTE